ncbi:MAG TPA: glycine cleavage system protein GcvH [Candidatus Dormibacteraeota bacterium]|jgi:glycine cleavage system H protein|nr:glycine cleavage system protein GcvH [Candidatus Dormibacteraeota bacterium]
MPEIRFSPSHIWARIDGDTAVLGLSDYIQDQLGDITSLQLPDIGDVLRATRRMGEVESEDATSPLEAPLTGEVIEVNPEVLGSPDLVNSDPFEAGWLIKLKLDDPAELEQLMSEEEYAELTTEV